MKTIATRFTWSVDSNGGRKLNIAAVLSAHGSVRCVLVDFEADPVLVDDQDRMIGRVYKTSSTQHHSHVYEAFAYEPTSVGDANPTVIQSKRMGTLREAAMWRSHV